MKNKKTSSRTFTFKKGKLKEQTQKEAMKMSELARALAAKKPFMQLVDSFMVGIGESLRQNQNTLLPEDALKLPVGAMAYILAHYYIYLGKVASVDDRKKFLKDFSDQVDAAIDIFGHG
jgi:hypothetical protein